MQETEKNKNLDHYLLSLPGLSIETENNSTATVSRVAIYIENKVDYVRRVDLEGQDSNLIIIDLVGKNKIQIINLYRSFSPQHLVPQRIKFVNQQLYLGTSIWIGARDLKSITVTKITMMTWTGYWVILNSSRLWNVLHGQELLTAL